MVSVSPFLCSLWRGAVALVLACAFCGLPARADGAEPWEPAYAALLQKYATPAGVRYAAWRENAADLQALRDLVATIAKNGPTDTSREGRLAYRINAYNVAMLGEVLAAYPIKSVKDLAPNFGVFSQDRITLAGEKMSLNRLEKELLLAEFREPRVHFAVNCASRSCPPLQAAPFTAAKLDAQLDAAARAYLNENPLGLALDGRALRVSEIFRWYADDFATAGGALAFIRRYRDLPANALLSYQPYDWSLNETP